MAKRDRPIYAFIHVDGKLIPEMAYDRRALDGLKQNQRVKVDIDEWRSRGRLRAYWKMLQEAVDATGCAPSKEVLHEAVKLDTGHINHVRLASGLTVAVPASIAFDAMDEPQMIAFFEAAQEVLARNYGFVMEAAA